MHAWVCGEHDEAQVSLWSTAQLLGLEPADIGQRLDRLRGVRHLVDFPAAIAQYKPQVFELLAAERIREAFATVEALPPDLRGERTIECGTGPPASWTSGTPRARRAAGVFTTYK